MDGDHGEAQTLAETANIDVPVRQDKLGTTRLVTRHQGVQAWYTISQY